jgi:microcystin-dependent protein
MINLKGIIVMLLFCVCLCYDSSAQGKQKKLSISNAIIPIGTILPFAGVYNDGDLGGVWLTCDGRSLRKADYQQLAQIIETSWGEGDNNPKTFNLPDLRGVFLRGVSNNTNDDPERDTRVARKPGGNTGDKVGSFQTDQVQNHNHNAVITDNTGIHGHPIEIARANISGSNRTRDVEDGDDKMNSDPGLGTITAKTSDNSGGHSHPVVVSDPASGQHGLETRPKNVNVYYIIRVK